jgi:hypothetical protein
MPPSSFAFGQPQDLDKYLVEQQHLLTMHGQQLQLNFQAKHMHQLVSAQSHRLATRCKSPMLVMDNYLVEQCLVVVI